MARARSQLDALALLRWTLPSGRHGRIDYSGEEPVLSSRLQDFFGLQQTPRLAGGRHAVLVHLLSPAGRPAAVTRDLESFEDLAAGLRLEREKLWLENKEVVKDCCAGPLSQAPLAGVASIMESDAF